jgi:hypothetical protein
MKTCFLFILSLKIYFTVVLTKNIFFKIYFLKPQLKIFLLNIFLKTIIA